MSEDQGATKGQDNSDANVKADAAIPVNPAALSDKDLEKVAGGASLIGGSTNTILYPSRAINTFFTPNK